MKSVLLAGMLFALLAVAAPIASANRTQGLEFDAPRDIISADAATRARSFEDLDSIGVKGLRIILYWRDVAPNASSRERPVADFSDPAVYDFSRYDPAIAEAGRRGWRVQLTVSGPVPRWATNGARNQIDRPSPSEFRLFMMAVSRHYSAQVTRYAIWNEPNHPAFLGPQYDGLKRPVSPRIYRGLYVAALNGLDAVGDRTPVLMGETAPSKSSRMVGPEDFLRGALCLNKDYKRGRGCAKLRTAGWAHHAYTKRAGPLVQPVGALITIGDLRPLTRALDRAAKAGAIRNNAPLYLTEFGVQSVPDPFYGVSYQRQNEYRAIAEKIAYDNPRVRAFSQYLLTDDRPDAVAGQQYGGFESGLRRNNGRNKPAFDGFRLPVVADLRGSRVDLWGLVRPGSGVRRVTIEYRDSGGGWRKLRTLRTNALGYWNSRQASGKGRQWRASWTAATGTVYRSPGVRAYSWPERLR